MDKEINFVHYSLFSMGVEAVAPVAAAALLDDEAGGAVFALGEH